MILCWFTDRHLAIIKAPVLALPLESYIRGCYIMLRRRQLNSLHLLEKHHFWKIALFEIWWYILPTVQKDPSNVLEPSFKEFQIHLTIVFVNLWEVICLLCRYLRPDWTLFRPRFITFGRRLRVHVSWEKFSKFHCGCADWSAPLLFAFSAKHVFLMTRLLTFCLLVSSAVTFNFVNRLDTDQARRFVGPDLSPNCLTRWCYCWKNFSKKLILKKISRRQMPSG